MALIVAGAGASEITPPAGVNPAGYSHREGPSEGVHDELLCRALLLEDGPTRLGLVALDLLGIDFEVDAVIREAARAARVPPDHVLINCRHTHAGPATTKLEGLGVSDKEYVASLPERAAGTLVDATGRLGPASLRYAEAPARVGVNRRTRVRPGDRDGVAVLADARFGLLQPMHVSRSDEGGLRHGGP
ncbi:MAG: hypothetical protein GTN78_14805 [Gemmatimonadales bacterium]|nr:hypothetical protein [Gemmatimonadales bacterium]